MAKINSSQVNSSPEVVRKHDSSKSKNKDHSSLMELFSPLLQAVNKEIIEQKKDKGNVEILGSMFQIKNKQQIGKREIGKSLAATWNIKQTSISNFTTPIQLVLSNTKKTPDIQQIEITIPQEGNLMGQVSLITVTDKNRLITSFTPSSNTFIKRQEGSRNRTRITAEATTEESC